MPREGSDKRTGAWLSKRHSGAEPGNVRPSCVDGPGFGGTNPIFAVRLENLV